MIVIDASVAVKWFAPEQDQEEALTLLASPQPLLAPDLIIAEALHAIRRKLRRGEVTQDQFLRAGSALPTYFDDLVPSVSVVEEATRLSIRLDHGFYDCVYLALALTSGATLVTADEVFAEKIATAGLNAATSLRNWSGRLSERVAIPEHIVAEIGRLADRVQATFRSLEPPRRPGELTIFRPSEIYGPAFDSPAYRRLQQLILSLTVNERAQVIALGWYGREYERGELTTLVENARQLFAKDPEKDLPYILSVMGTVRAGYEKLPRLSGDNTQAE